MDAIKFTIPGAPYGKARHRTTRTGINYTPRETVSYEGLIKVLYIEAAGIRDLSEDPFEVMVSARFPIPKSVSSKRRALMLDGKIRPTKKPDWDNIGKIVTDALNKIAYRDDSQVVACRVEKWYGPIPEVIVTLGPCS